LSLPDASAQETPRRRIRLTGESPAPTVEHRLAQRTERDPRRLDEHEVRHADDVIACAGMGVGGDGRGCIYTTVVVQLLKLLRGLLLQNLASGIGAGQ